jgi:hypothetical protein
VTAERRHVKLSEENITLRVRKSLIERVEGASKERPLKTPANTRITEAVMPPLEKEFCR